MDATCYEILKSAFKWYAREHWYFDNPPKDNYIDQTDWNRKMLYTTYDNCIELSEKAEKEWRKIINITWFDELAQMNLWFEYDVQYTFVSKDHLEDLKAKKETEDCVREWHKRFTSLIQTEWLKDWKTTS